LGRVYHAGGWYPTHEFGMSKTYRCYWIMIRWS
jgi:hypothetical protein